MVASAIAIPTFGSGRALIATDLADGVHTLQVTTETPDSAIAIWGFGSTKYLIGTVESEGIHTLCVSTESPDSGIAVWGWGSEKYVIGTIESDGVHVLCVTTDEPDSAIAMPAFQSGRVILATVESDGVHVPVVTDAESGDAPFALWEWGNQKTIIAADTSGDGPAVVPVVLGMEPPYDPDAAAYIAATGELFPDALNAMVVGIKADGDWDLLGAFKKAIGVPNLAASLIDLRNPAFTGTAANTPGHSATEGWSFTAASSQYIDTGWRCGATDSKGSLDSVHVGLRMLAFTGAFVSIVVVSSPDKFLGWFAIVNGDTNFRANQAFSGPANDAANPAAPGHLIGTRTAPNAIAAYRDGGSAGTNTTASTTIPAQNFFIACRNNSGNPDAFSTGRVGVFHAGAGLDAAAAARITARIDTYCAAAGET